MTPDEMILAIVACKDGKPMQRARIGTEEWQDCVPRWDFVNWKYRENPQPPPLRKLAVPTVRRCVVRYRYNDQIYAAEWRQYDENGEPRGYYRLLDLYGETSQDARCVTELTPDECRAAGVEWPWEETSKPAKPDYSELRKWIENERNAFTVGSFSYRSYSEILAKVAEQLENQ